MSDPLHDRFDAMYAEDHTPWDSGITPPEIMALLKELPAGRAVDLGCGTGTNALTLAAHGWQVTGIDFVAKAIEKARTKAQNSDAGERVRFVQADVRTIAEHVPPGLDLAVDIGCGHVFDGEDYAQYAKAVAKVLRPGATWMIYMHHPSEERGGLAPQAAIEMLNADFELLWHEEGIDSARGGGSSWMRLTRRA